jgi:hypothetical protein
MSQDELLGFPISSEFCDLIEPRVNWLAGWPITVAALTPTLVE